MQMDRTNTSIIGRWWWTVDRLTLAAVIVLMALGALLVTASSPPVAERIGLNPFYFVERQHIFLLGAFIIMMLVSLLPPQYIRGLAVFGFVGGLVLLVMVPIMGYETKGAQRWIHIAGLSIQPSEFVKPCMAVTMAWVFSLRYQHANFPGFRIATLLYIMVLALLLMQPDFGMVVTVSAVWGMQFFLAGLPFFWVLMMAIAGVVGVISAYNFFPHVQHRIDNYLDPASGDNYQVSKSLEAFRNGGFFGRGPGEGEVKQHLPDSHTDFVFSVAGEEFGMFFTLLIVALFAFIVLRALVRVWNEKDFFILLAVAGLVAQFGIQAIINMGVAVNLLPAKGMTLPFLSYGGSSLFAVALGMGMLLALTRRRFG